MLWYFIKIIYELSHHLETINALLSYNNMCYKARLRKWCKRRPPDIPNTWWTQYLSSLKLFPNGKSIQLPVQKWDPWARWQQNYEKKDGREDSKTNLVIYNIWIFGTLTWLLDLWTDKIWNKNFQLFINLDFFHLNDMSIKSIKHIKKERLWLMLRHCNRSLQVLYTGTT